MSSILRRTCGVVAAALGAVMLAAGCSAGEGRDPAVTVPAATIAPIPPPPPSSATTSPPTTSPPTAAPRPTAAPPPTAPPTTGPEAPRLVDLDAVDDFADWQLIVDAAEFFGPVAVFDGTVLAGNRPADGDAVTVRQPGGTEIVVHRPPAGWILDDAALAAGRLVVTQFENSDGDYEIWAYGLSGSAGTLIEEWAGEPLRHAIPQTSLDGDRLAWNTTLPDGTSCIRVRDLATGDQFDAACSSGPAEVLGWPRLNWPTLTYRADPADGEPCPTLFSVELPAGPVTPLPERRACRGFQGVLVDGTAVWFEMPPGSPNAFRTSIVGTGGNGTFYDLGVGVAGSIRTCAGRIFWGAELGDVHEIRTWAPGEPLRVLYRSPEDKTPTTAATCADGWLTIARSFTGAGPRTLDVLSYPIG